MDVETTDTAPIIFTNLHGDGKATPEDIEGPEGPIGVGSSVESSGFIITEIADGTNLVELLQTEEQKSFWRFSEPLITPAEEEIVQAIGDLCATLNDDINNEELSPSTDDPVLEVIATAEDTLGDLQFYVDLCARPSGTLGLPDYEVPLGGGVLDNVSQPEANPLDRVLEILPSVETGDDAEPLDLQDGLSLLPSATEVEMGDGAGI
jgi:hypothetical protein